MNTKWKVSLIALSIFVLACSSAVNAAPSVTVGSLSGDPGTSVDIPVNFTAGATGISVIQFDLLLPSGISSDGSVTAGPAATGASKSVLGSPISGGLRVVIYGSVPNQNAMSTGLMVTARLNIAANATAGAKTIQISNLVGADADAAGVSVTGNAGTVTVNNTTPADKTSPTVSITAPANNAAVSATIALSANASDNVGVVGVQFKVDGANAGPEDTVTPYSYSLNTISLSNGAHTVTAVARDAAGNTATSSPISITVNNVVAGSVISAGFVSGDAGTSVILPINFTASSTGVSTLQFDLALPSGISYQSTVTAGSAVTSAGKSALAQTVSGGVRILIYGGNSALGSGSLANIQLSIAADASSGVKAVSVSGIVAADANAAGVSATGIAGAVTVNSGSPVKVFENLRIMVPPSDDAHLIVALKTNDPIILNQVKSGSVTVTVSLPSGNKVFSMKPVAGDPNSLYCIVSSATLSSSDLNMGSGSGIAVKVGTNTVTSTVEPNVIQSAFGGKVSLGKVTVVIQPGDISGEGQVGIVQLASNSSRKNALAKCGLISLGNEADLSLSAGSISKASISLPYDASLIPAGLNVANARVAYYNPVKDAWEVQDNVAAQGDVLNCSVAHFSIYMPVLMMPVGAPEMKEIYVYPNPAVGSQEPVVHVKLGLVDTVEVTVYDVSGAKVHSASFAGDSPQIGGDGDYYYEYRWSEGKASGVYVAVVKGKTSTTTVSGKVKFAVVK